MFVLGYCTWFRRETWEVSPCLCCCWFYCFLLCWEVSENRHAIYKLLLPFYNSFSFLLWFNSSFMALILWCTHSLGCQFLLHSSVSLCFSDRNSYRYHFNKNCVVVQWSGDNPNSLAGEFPCFFSFPWWIRTLSNCCLHHWRFQYIDKLILFAYSFASCNRPVLDSLWLYTRTGLGLRHSRVVVHHRHITTNWTFGSCRVDPRCLWRSGNQSWHKWHCKRLNACCLGCIHCIDFRVKEMHKDAICAEETILFFLMLWRLNYILEKNKSRTFIRALSKHYLYVIMPITQVFGFATDHKPSLDGHVFPNPVDTKSFMVMLVYKNGSLTREGTTLVSDLLL